MGCYGMQLSIVSLSKDVVAHAHAFEMPCFMLGQLQLITCGIHVDGSLIHR